MNIFDKIIKTYSGFPGYKGDVPTNENEFNALELLGEWNDKPSWDEINLAIQKSLYKDQRANAYPTIQEQLDMQYWDSVNGTTTWQDAIEAVKTQYPKP